MTRPQSASGYWGARPATLSKRRACRYQQEVSTLTALASTATDQAQQQRTAAPSQVTTQHLPPSRVGAIPRGADFALEVIAHHLTEAKRRAFAEEAAAMFAQLLPTKARGRIARLLGINADPARQIAFQFDELSPAISDPVIEDPELWAARSKPLLTPSRQVGRV